MVQLTRDPENLPTVGETAARILNEYLPLNKVETVPLMQASGRILAEDIFAGVSVPSFNNSAVDGYAINHVHFSDKMPVSARIIAGDKVKIYDNQTAIRIFTGAALPQYYDTVYMQEDVQFINDIVHLPKGLKKGSNARLIGEDMQQGDLAITKGTKLSPRHIALLAALGLHDIKVTKTLKIGIFSTGNEIVDAGNTLTEGKIYDANRYLLASLLQSEQVIDLGILPDNKDLIANALQKASHTCDIILTSGGVSTGDEDHIKAAVALDFWRIGIKPGRPVAMGRVNDTPFVGLPGNPVAVFITFAYVVKPLIAALLGAIYSPPQSFPVVLGFDYNKKTGRREYVRVNLQNNIAHKFEQDGAGVITSLTKTDGLIEFTEEQTQIKKGESAGFIPYIYFSGS
jgi:molybdopterin molybdotransferase